MKTKKLFVALFASLVIASSASAFDGATFWKEYGGGIKNGTSVINVGAALPDFGWIVPPITASYERAVHINNMLPFTFGAQASFSLRQGGYSYLSVDALAKYHFNFGVEQLDVYGGLLVGPQLQFNDGLHFWFDYGLFVGAGWYFNDKFGVVVETGYPYWLNAKFSIKF